MISGKNILCFGSENWNYPGFQQTIMRKLSSENRVIFVNPVGSRKVSLQGSQLKFYFKRIKMLFAKRSIADENLMVCSPRIIPLVYNSTIAKLNRLLIRQQFRKILSKHDFKPYILWIGTPTAAFFVDIFKPELMVYHAVDRFSKFTFVDQEKIRVYEEKVARKADVILCTSDVIKDDLIRFNQRAITVTHAVDFEHFSSCGNGMGIPKDVQGIPTPIIGYFGGLSERVNIDLLKQVAMQYPDASLVLIGKRLTDLSAINHLNNVYILGQKAFDILPNYLKTFNVCLIPYNVDELMAGVDPIKLREYLCLGKPVVSTNLPEVEKLSRYVYIGKTEQGFIAKVGEALKENNPNIRKQRIQVARQCDWPIKLKDISGVLREMMLQKKTSRAA